MNKSHLSVDEIVERVISDTSAEVGDELLLLDAPNEVQNEALRALRIRDVPVLSTDDACGPG